MKSAKEVTAPNPGPLRRKFLFLMPFLTLFMGTACSSTQPESTKTLPVKIYRYTFEAAPSMSSSLSDAQIADIMRQVDEIWAAAGIKWQPLATENQTIDRKQFSGPSTDRKILKEQLRSLAPRDSNSNLWQVVLIGEFPVPAGGLYLPDVRTVFFAEKARGGPTSPIILAHELGHSLALRHERDSSNLMNPAAGGRDVPQQHASTLTDAQAEIARSQAAIGPLESVVYTEPEFTPQAQGKKNPGANSNDRKARIASRLRSFDHDHDGVVLLEDVPPPGQRMFRQLDRNGDERLDQAELSDYEH